MSFGSTSASSCKPDSESMKKFWGGGRGLYILKSEMKSTKVETLSSAKGNACTQSAVVASCVVDVNPYQLSCPGSSVGL